MSGEFGVGSYHEVINSDRDLIYWITEDDLLYFASRKNYDQTVKQVNVDELKNDLINLSKLLVKPQLEFQLETSGDLISFRKTNDIIYMVFEGAREFSVGDVQNVLGLLNGYYEQKFNGEYTNDILPFAKI